MIDQNWSFWHKKWRFWSNTSKCRLKNSKCAKCAVVQSHIPWFFKYSLSFYQIHTLLLSRVEIRYFGKKSLGCSIFSLKLCIILIFMNSGFSKSPLFAHLQAILIFEPKKVIILFHFETFIGIWITYFNIFTRF